MKRDAEHSEIDLALLASMVTQKRGDRTMRQAAAVIGVNASTVHRTEHGGMPDLPTYALFMPELHRDGATIGLPAVVVSANDLARRLAGLESSVRALSGNAATLALEAEVRLGQTP